MKEFLQILLNHSEGFFSFPGHYLAFPESTVTTYWLCGTWTGGLKEICNWVPYGNIVEAALGGGGGEQNQLWTI